MFFGESPQKKNIIAAFEVQAWEAVDFKNKMLVTYIG